MQRRQCGWGFSAGGLAVRCASGGDICANVKAESVTDYGEYGFNSMLCLVILMWRMKGLGLLYRVGRGAVALGHRDIKRAGDQYRDAKQRQRIGEVTEEIPAQSCRHDHLGIG